MNKKTSKFISMLVVLVMMLTLFTPVTAFAGTGEITILYTNDIHTYIDNGDGFDYAKLATLKKQYDDVLLVDAGDHIQGTAYGSMDKGETIIDLMEAAGYDLATLGNHEFDYGMLQALNVAQNSAFPYVSCNFYNEKDGAKCDPVLGPYQIFEINGKKVAFVGITTPETFTKSTPAYFQNEKGEYIYGISGGEDGAELYNDVQVAIDAAKYAGADYIIALGHLGDDPASVPWTSEEVIANTTGFDAFIDGHSHSTVAGKEVKDKAGETVLLTQTGEYFDAVGKMVIKADGTITTELLTDASAVKADEAVAKIQDAWIEEINTKLGEVIGEVTFTFDNYDADGNRLVRKQETNTGAFAADALYYLFENLDYDVDVAIMNGGGVRNKAITGEISYLTCKEIHTFGNVACLQTITGQQLLDALEWGAKDVGTAENGGFLHVSGVKYSVNSAIPSTVQKDEKGVWTGGPTGAYRVTDVKVLNNKTGKYEALDLDAKYNLAGYNYTLRDLGDGFAMFDGAVNVIDYVMEDYMVLANYVKSFEGGKITDENSVYEDVDEIGRIKIYADEEEAALAAIANITPDAKSAKTAKGNTKVTLKFDEADKAIIDSIEAAGYKVEYAFYRSAKKTAGYKEMLTKDEAVYTNLYGVKGQKYFYKAVVQIVDEDGKVVGQSNLDQCKYACRKW